MQQRFSNNGNSQVFLKIINSVRDGYQQISVIAAVAALGLLCVLNVAMSAETAGMGEMSELRLAPMESGAAGSGDVIVQQADMLSTEIDSVITGFIIRTTVRQKFRNPTNNWMEGIYQFPLPDDAAVDGMVLVIGERRIVSEIKEKAEAKKTYQKAAAEGKKAALLRQYRPNMFSTSVANIEPGGDIMVELSFQSLAEQDGVNFTWRMPQAITPRYNSPLAPTYVKDGEVTQGAEQYDPAGNRNETSFRIAMQNARILAALESPTHDIDLSQSEGDARIVRLASGTVPADRDFILNWQFAQDETASMIVFRENLDGADYLLGMVLPPVSHDSLPALPRDITFIVDVSGSMHGISMEQARKALLKGLELLQPEDRFDIIAFNDRSWRLFGQSQPANAQNIGRAEQFVSGLQADRGTEMYPALAAALGDDKDETFLRQIVFLTDGAVSNEQRMFDLVQGSLGPARLFTVGLGNAPNSWFMRKAAEAGRGVHLQVSNLANTQTELESLFADMSAPTLQNIQLTLTENADVYPRQIADLFGQRPLVFVARQEVSDQPIQVAALTTGGDNWQQNLTMTDASPGAGVAKLWARRKIESLTDARSRGMDPEIVKTAVLDLSLSHGIMSEFTSFVAVDQTPVRVKEDFMKKVKLAGNLPKGTSWQKFYGPKTATPMVWQFISGGILLFLALALYFAFRRGIRKS